MLVGVQSLCGVSDERVRGSTDGHYNAVNIEYELAVRLLDRSAAAGSVRLAKLHLNALHAGYELVLVAQYFNGVVEGLEDDALLHCVLYFFLTCGHFFQTAAVYYVYVLGAQTLSAARRVHCNVAAADNRNACVLLDRSVALRLVCLHEVNSGEELVSGVNALEVLAGDIHESRQTCAGTDEDCLVALFIHQLIHRYRLTDNYVCLDINAELLHVLDLRLYNTLFRETELRDTVG